MISDKTNNWHYLAVKSISGLTRGITSNHNGDFVCLNCFHSYTTKIKLNKHKGICKDHDFCKCLTKIIKFQNTTLEKNH